MNKVNKLLKVDKSPVCFKLEAISKKTTKIVSIIGTSHIFTISYIFTHFFCRHNVRKQARGECIHTIM